MGRKLQSVKKAAVRAITSEPLDKSWSSGELIRAGILIYSERTCLVNESKLEVWTKGRPASS